MYIMNEHKVYEIVDKANRELSQIPSVARVGMPNNRYDVFKHCQEVAKWAVALMMSTGITKESTLIEYAKVGLLHDRGKVYIPDSILDKAGTLTPQEYAIKKQHVAYSGEMVLNSNLSEGVKRGVIEHHERLDGSGYNKGLKGSEISKYAQVIAVCDVFDKLERGNHVRPSLPDFNLVVNQMRGDKGLNQEYVNGLLKLYVDFWNYLNKISQRR